MWWCFGTREEVSPRVVAWRPESNSTLSSPLYQRMLQFNAFSSLLQRGVGLSEFAMEFRNAAEWPISHCRMMGCEHSSFEGFVKYLVCSGRQKHSQRMATSPESPAIMVSTAESSAIIDTTLVFLGIMDVPHEVKRVSPGCWKLVSSLADPQLISDRAAGISPIVYNPVREPSESTPEPAPVREPSESTPEPAPVRESAPVQESAPQSTPIREPTESAPAREPKEAAPEPGRPYNRHHLFTSDGLGSMHSKSSQIITIDYSSG